MRPKIRTLSVEEVRRASCGSLAGETPLHADVHCASVGAARLRARMGNYLGALEKMFGHTGNPCFAWEARRISRVLDVRCEWVEQYLLRCEEALLRMADGPRVGASGPPTVESAMGFVKRGKGIRSGTTSASKMFRNWAIYFCVQEYLDDPQYKDAAFKNVAQDMEMEEGTVRKAYDNINNQMRDAGIEGEMRAEAGFRRDRLSRT